MSTNECIVLFFHPVTFNDDVFLRNVRLSHVIEDQEEMMIIEYDGSVIDRCVSNEVERKGIVICGAIFLMN